MLPQIIYVCLYKIFFQKKVNLLDNNRYVDIFCSNLFFIYYGTVP